MTFFSLVNGRHTEKAIVGMVKKKLCELDLMLMSTAMDLFKTCYRRYGMNNNKPMAIMLAQILYLIEIRINEQASDKDLIL